MYGSSRKNQGFPLLYKKISSFFSDEFEFIVNNYFDLFPGLTSLSQVKDFNAGFIWAHNFVNFAF